jgi:hypothetical protein
MSKPSPTSRTLAKLKELGFTAAITERWNSFARIRQDLFGFVDLVAVHPNAGIYFIQACAGASHAARRAKVLAEPRAATVVAAGGRVEVISWAKQGGRGEVKRWQWRREDLTGELKQ